MTQKSYREKLTDPRWQKKRLEIFERDNWQCQNCFDDKSCLQVHHKIYITGREPWQYNDTDLITLCAGCHKKENNLESEHKIATAASFLSVLISYPQYTFPEFTFLKYLLKNDLIGLKNQSLDQLYFLQKAPNEKAIVYYSAVLTMCNKILKNA